MTARVRAPELRGRGWLNTGGKELKLADLRGKVVLLDFWTFCCINCLHVLDELRPLEDKYGDALVVIGVHSPKFEHERDPAALAAAVERYGVHHPVLDDADMAMWQQYAAKAWPTLSVLDPEGYVVASMAGEGHAEGLTRLLDELIATHEAKGTLHRGDGPYVAPPASDTLLRFPGKAIELPSGNLLVSDSARHSLGLTNFDYSPPEYDDGMIASTSDQFALATTYCELKSGQPGCALLIREPAPGGGQGRG